MSRNCATWPAMPTPTGKWNASANRLRNYGASSTRTWGRGSARKSRVISSARTLWILLVYCLPISLNCMVTAVTPTTKRSSRDWESFTVGRWLSSDTKKDVTPSSGWRAISASPNQKVIARLCGSCSWRRNSGGRFSLLLIRPGRTRGSMPKNGDRAKPLRAIFARWPGCRCR